MDLTAGMMVNPRVQLVRLLGRGAMGSVWVAEHLTLETQVAVKFIKAELAAEGSGQILERFKREAKAAAQIKSPHVVQTFDQGFMDDDTPYIVMELLQGETLGERLQRRPRLALSEANRIIERAFTTGNAGLLGSLVSPYIQVRNHTLGRQKFEESASRLFHAHPDYWIQHDVCDVVLFERDGEHGWSADCNVVVQQGGQLGVWIQRYAFAGVSGKVRTLDEPRVFRKLSVP